jgi:hypothetical protein
MQWHPRRQTPGKFHNSHGGHTARQNCRAGPGEIALVTFKTFPASVFVETGVHVNKSGEFWMR